MLIVFHFVSDVKDQRLLSLRVRHPEKEYDQWLKKRSFCFDESTDATTLGYTMNADMQSRFLPTPSETKNNRSPEFLSAFYSAGTHGQDMSLTVY